MRAIGSEVGTKNRAIWVLAGFTAGVVATGLPYWTIPYSQVSLPNTLVQNCLLPIALVAVLLPLVSGLGIVRSAMAVGIAVPGAVFARMVVDTSRDPTSHNLWPIEVMIAMVVGMAVAWPGAGVGELLRRFAGRLGVLR
jgi:hypothetical protein